MPKFTATLNLPQYSTAPSSPSNGDLYYNTTASKAYARVGGAWVEIGLPQSIGTTSTPTFGAVTAGYFNATNVGSSSVSGSTVTVASVGTTLLDTGFSATVTPAFIGQKFLVSSQGGAHTNTATVQYLIHSVSDSANNTLFLMRTHSGGSGVTFTDSFFGQMIWAADTTSAKVFKQQVRMQSSTGVTVSIIYGGMTFIPIP